MRPQSIVNFERAVLLSLALGVAHTILAWDQVAASVAPTGFGTDFILIVQAVTIALYLLLIWLISRKASVVAKWIYVVLCGLGLLFGIAGLGQVAQLYGTASLAVTIAQYLLSLLTLWLLFRPDSNAWFRDGRGPVDPNIFS